MSLYAPLTRHSPDYDRELNDKLRSILDVGIDYDVPDALVSDRQVTLKGDARVYRHIRVTAPSWKGGVSAPADGFVGIVPTIDFDAASDDEAHYSVLVPYRFEAGSTIDFAVDWVYEGAADAGTVCWGIEYRCICSEGVVDGTTTTVLQITAGGHTTGQLVRTVFDTGIIGACAHDDLAVRLYRDVSADSLAVDACVIEVHFEILMDKLGEAI